MEVLQDKMVCHVSVESTGGGATRQDGVSCFS